jgi:hypothetical protein
MNSTTVAESSSPIRVSLPARHCKWLGRIGEACNLSPTEVVRLMVTAETEMLAAPTGWAVAGSPLNREATSEAGGTAFRHRPAAYPVPQPASRPVVETLRSAHERLKALRKAEETRAGEPPASRSTPAAGSEAERSTLAQRVERLLDEVRSRRRREPPEEAVPGPQGDPTTRRQAVQLMEEALRAIRDSTRDGTS